MIERCAKRAGAGVLALVCLAALAGCSASAAGAEAQTATTFAMDTLIEQRAWGRSAQDAMRQLNLDLADWDSRLSLFAADSDIARINAAAGKSGVPVAQETVLLLRQALELSAQSEGAFAVTVAPLTLAWGVTSEAPRVPEDEEIARLLPLVNDGAVRISGNHVSLDAAGMAIDLGGIAKGAVARHARNVYEEYGVTGALLSIGGNVYAHGTKPDGTPFRVAFRDPAGSDASYIASFEMRDEVIAVSGGYERFFEQNGRRYIHIMNPATGCPAESDIVSVGVVHEDGAVADFWSTTLFVWGRDKALDYMRSGGCAILLDSERTLYVSQRLQAGFELTANDGAYNVVFVPEAA